MPFGRLIFVYILYFHSHFLYIPIVKYLKSYRVFESVDLIVQDIDKYKPMLKLMSDILNYHAEPNYQLYDSGQIFNTIYSILDKFYSLFGVKGLKIGDKRYSLSADGDNELNKLKELRNIRVGHGEDITFNPELYFEDLKLIDWLLWKIEQDEYHIVTVLGVYMGGVIWVDNRPVTQLNFTKEFKSNLASLETWYNLAKDLQVPKYTQEDIEDMLLAYIDQRIIERLQIYPQYSNDNFDLLYVIKFDVPVKYDSDHDNNLWIDNFCKEIYESCFKRYFNHKPNALINNLFIYDCTDTYRKIADVSLKLIQRN